MFVHYLKSKTGKMIWKGIIMLIEVRFYTTIFLTRVK